MLTLHDGDITDNTINEMIEMMLLLQTLDNNDISLLAKKWHASQSKTWGKGVAAEDSIETTIETQHVNLSFAFQSPAASLSPFLRPPSQY